MFQNIRGALAQISGVGVLTSILYLWAYWSTFGIPIFEYANLKDIITGTVILLGSSFAIPFAVLTIRELMLPKLKPIPITETKIGQFLWRIGPIISLLYFVFLAILWFSSFTNKKLIFPPLLAIYVQTPIEKSGFLSDIEDKGIRSILIYLFVCAISFSYLSGKSRAEAILNDGSETLYEVKSGRKYLGHTNGYFFFLSPDNSKVIMNKASSRDSLVLVSAANKTAKKDSD